MIDYQSFIERKKITFKSIGIRVENLNPNLFAWQSEIVRWSLRKGRSCLFEDCGLGKTIQQLAWAEQIPGDVLIFTPLAVAEQTKAEADRFGIDARISRDGSHGPGITITNYEKIHLFDLGDFTGVVLDESSILKNYAGKFRTHILEATASTEYKLACTATPAPNDFMELANHAEFVGAMTRGEMLSTFFVHDGGQTSKWRLKKHATTDFWEWVASWAITIRSPGDIGYPRDGFDLPPMEVIEHHIASNVVTEAHLVGIPAISLQEQRVARRATLASRVDRVAELVNGSSEQWVVWCELNDEGDALESAIPDASQISGKDSEEDRVDRLRAFLDGDIRVLVSKASITGFGMNWQHCRNMAFVGVSHSWEKFYQAVRRCWRYGQKKPFMSTWQPRISRTPCGRT